MVSNKKSLHNPPAHIAILTTLLYSDIFSFPLSEEELWHFLMTEKKVTRDAFANALTSLKKQIVSVDGFFCLHGREEIIVRRKKNSLERKKKMQRAQFVATKIAHIPSILFIGISGGLASGNVSQRDDIDFVIITKKNTLFISRFLILVFLQLLGARRFRNQKDAADTICVNLLFDETVLDWFADKQDVYTAREIAQIVPLFEREKVYLHFIRSNRWIKNFLPNAAYQKAIMGNSDNNVFVSFVYRIVFTSFFETICRVLQQMWMRRHQTREIITNHFLAFHPKNYRVKILEQLRIKSQQYGLLTKF